MDEDDVWAELESRPRLARKIFIFGSIIGTIIFIIVCCIGLLTSGRLKTRDVAYTESSQNNKVSSSTPVQPTPQRVPFTVLQDTTYFTGRPMQCTVRKGMQGSAAAFSIIKDPLNSKGLVVIVRLSDFCRNVPNSLPPQLVPIENRNL